MYHVHVDLIDPDPVRNLCDLQKAELSNIQKETKLYLLHIKYSFSPAISF